MKEDLVNTHAERANLRWSVTDLALKERGMSVDLGGALQAVVESSNRSSENVADKV